MLTYEEYLAARAPWEATIESAGATLKAYPREPNGLTLDAAKDRAWYQAMREIESARTSLQRLARTNRAATRYKNEMRAESQARRAKWGKPVTLEAVSPC